MPDFTAFEAEDYQEPVSQPVEYREPPAVFQARQQAAQRVADDRFVSNLVSNARVQDAARNIAAARTFIEMRAFDRDVAAAKASGLSAEQAAFQAAVRHPGAFGSAAPGFINAVRPVPQPSVMPLPGVGNVVRSGLRGERVQFPPASMTELEPPTVGTPVTTPEGQLLGHAIRSGRGSFNIRPTEKVKPLNEFETRELGRLFQEEAAISRELAKAPPEMQKEPGWLSVHKPDLERLATIRSRLEEYRTKAAGGPSSAPTITPKTQPKRVTVTGPQGQKGTVPEGTAMPTGWKLVP